MIHNLRERKYFFQMAGQIIATIRRPQRWFSNEDKEELFRMNEDSFHGDTSLIVNGIERFLLRLKAGNSPGLAVKAGLWSDIPQAQDQSEIAAPSLIHTVRRMLKEVEKNGSLPSCMPGAARLFTAARKLDRYSFVRVHGECRPSSHAISYWSTCMPIQVPDNRFEAVESWLFRQSPRFSASTDLKSIRRIPSNG